MLRWASEGSPLDYCLNSSSHPTQARERTRTNQPENKRSTVGGVSCSRTPGWPLSLGWDYTDSQMVLTPASSRDLLRSQDGKIQGRLGLCCISCLNSSDKQKATFPFPRTWTLYSLFLALLPPPTPPHPASCRGIVALPWGRVGNVLAQFLFIQQRFIEFLLCASEQIRSLPSWSLPSSRGKAGNKSCT